MKKILSILLAMVMIVSSITVALIAIADEPETITAEEAVTKINKATDYVANAGSGDAEHQLPSYALLKSVQINDIFSGEDNINVMNSIMAAKYPEYAKEPYCSGGAYDFTAILKNLIDVNDVSETVKKNSDASLTLGRDALKATTLKDKDVESAKIEVDQVLDTKKTVLEYKDIDIVAGDRVEDTVLPDVTNAYPQVTGLDKIIKNSVKEHNTAITFEKFNLSMKDIKIKAEFNDNNLLASLEYSYTLVGTAEFTYISEEPIVANINVEVSALYNSFDYSKDEINIAELVARINEGTANMVNTKAGYVYARNSSFVPQEDFDYTFNISTNGMFNSENGLVGIVLKGLLGKVDNVLIGINKDYGTNIHLTKWVCKNAGNEDATKICSAKNPHQVWQCTCKDVDGCCTCCAGAGCTSTHPCDKKNGTCTSADCKCGWVTDPECHYQDISDSLDSFDIMLDGALRTLAEKLNEGMGTAAKEQFAIGDTSAIIPVASNATDKLDKRFAVKGTDLTVFDIESENVSYNSAKGTINFKLPDQYGGDDNYSILSHFTNDFVTNEQFVEALKLSLFSKLGDTVGSIFTNTALEYSNIQCAVKFKGASDGNIYGTGEIERIDLSYGCSAYCDGIISYSFETKMASTVKNIEYADYEKGDVNMDTSVSLKDAKLVLRYVAELETLNDYQMLLADMNEDSAVTIVDAKAILEKIASQTV